MTNVGWRLPPRPGSPVRTAVAPNGREPQRVVRRMGDAPAGPPNALGPEFLGLISHELRAPMTVIVGMSHLLAEGALDESRYREVAADIALNADILDELLDGLMLLARPEKSTGPVEGEPIILAATAAEALAIVRQRYPECSFILEGADRHAIVEAPHTWVASAVKNLAANAAKYGGAAPVVTVQVERERGLAVLRVLDRGPGFSQAEADRLFEPFFRTASAQRQASGAGLGSRHRQGDRRTAQWRGLGKAPAGGRRRGRLPPPRLRAMGRLTPPAGLRCRPQPARGPTPPRSARTTPKRAGDVVSSAPAPPTPPRPSHGW